MWQKAIWEDSCDKFWKTALAFYHAESGVAWNLDSLLLSLNWIYFQQKMYHAPSCLVETVKPEAMSLIGMWNLRASLGTGALPWWLPYMGPWDRCSWICWFTVKSLENSGMEQTFGEVGGWNRGFLLPDPKWTGAACPLVVSESLLGSNRRVGKKSLATKSHMILYTTRGH